MHRLVWILQIVLGVYFVVAGVMHFVVPDGLPAQLDWMYELSTWAHWASGAAEIAGGLGLVVPAVARVRTELVPLAALGLLVIMLSAAVWHASRGEAQNLVTNLIVAALLGFVGWVRWRVHPHRS